MSIFKELEEIFGEWVLRTNSGYKTSYTESGKTVKIDRKIKERILFTQLDGKKRIGFLAHFSGIKSDFFVYYTNDNEATLLVELKGKDVRHAIKQLENTIETRELKPALDLISNAKKTALVVSRGSSMKETDFKKFQRKFLRDTTFQLRRKTITPGGIVDLRDFV